MSQHRARSLTALLLVVGLSLTLRGTPSVSEKRSGQPRLALHFHVRRFQKFLARRFALNDPVCLTRNRGYVGMWEVPL